MTSNGKHFTVTGEMLTAVARVQRWPDVVAGIAGVFQNLLSFCFQFCLTTSVSAGTFRDISEFCLNFGTFTTIVHLSATV